MIQIDLIYHHHETCIISSLISESDDNHYSRYIIGNDVQLYKDLRYDSIFLCDAFCKYGDKIDTAI